MEVICKKQDELPVSGFIFWFLLGVIFGFINLTAMIAKIQEALTGKDREKN